MKRTFDIVVSGFLLLIAFPLIILAVVIIWLEDRHNPFYVSKRIGVGGKPFRLFKLRSMVADAAKMGGDAACADDHRITSVGRWLRRFKIDEIPQLFNVLKGDMSLVGPRPNVIGGTCLYTSSEQSLLSVRPGITDFSSVVFADLDSILEGSADPDLDYNRFVRPWKSRFGLFYIEKASLPLDCAIIACTAFSLLSRKIALASLTWVLRMCGADTSLVAVAQRREPLGACPPPGSEFITERIDGKLVQLQKSA